MNSIFRRVSIRKYQEKKIEQEKSINFLTFPTSPLTINLSFFIKVNNNICENSRYMLQLIPNFCRNKKSGYNA